MLAVMKEEDQAHWWEGLQWLSHQHDPGETWQGIVTMLSRGLSSKPSGVQDCKPPGPRTSQTKVEHGCLKMGIAPNSISELSPLEALQPALASVWPWRVVCRSLVLQAIVRDARWVEHWRNSTQCGKKTSRVWEWTQPWLIPLALNCSMWKAEQWPPGITYWFEIKYMKLR